MSSAIFSTSWMSGAILLHFNALALCRPLLMCDLNAVYCVLLITLALGKGRICMSDAIIMCTLHYTCLEHFCLL